MNHVELIINHLNHAGSIDWMIALREYGIGGGFRARITDVRRLLARYNIELPDRSVQNANGGYHNEYYLDKENWRKLRDNIHLMNFRSEKIKQGELF